MQRTISTVSLIVLAGIGSYASLAGLLSPLGGTQTKSDPGIPLRIGHQGVVLADGVRFTGNGGFRFALINSSSQNVWTNDGTQIGSSNPPASAVTLAVVDGLYSVQLGDTTQTNMTALQAGAFTDSDLVLRVWFDDGTHGSQQLAPDHKLSSVPYAFTAAKANDIADAVVTGPKIATGAVSSDKLAVGAAIPVGTILPFGGNTVPTGWLACDGSTVSRTTYADLFAAIGTAYGAGNGSTTMHLPDLRGYFLRGADEGTGHDPDAASRTALNPGGATGSNVGSYQADALKSHNHQYYTVTKNAVSGTVVIDSTKSGVDSHWASLFNTNSIGGNETRPRNVAVKYIIKY